MLSKNFWFGRRVLLTGHTGFKGSWLALWLLSMGADVWGYSLKPDESAPTIFKSLDFEHPNFSKLPGTLHHTVGDLCNLSGLQKIVSEASPQVVLHLAAQSLVRRSYYDPLGTWSTNVHGSLNLLESLKPLQNSCAVVMVTTDKVYANHEWDFGYRESDRLGGHDPYSASKAAAELAISSWRSSFCGSGPNQTPYLAIATARAGNVIGGGDWAEDRIVPDVMRSLSAGEVIRIRNPRASRPWQHVLEPLGGYLLLAEKLSENCGFENSFTSSFNFGPVLVDNRSVLDLVEAVLAHWPGLWRDLSDPAAPHEAGRLHLQIDKAHHQLGWRPCWPFATTVGRTVAWYKAVHQGVSPLECCLADLQAYKEASAGAC